MKAFENIVAETFAFLESSYGFSRIEGRISIGESVEYLKAPLSIFIGRYKGEVDISLHVDLEVAKSHEVFRPYISRTFTPSEIALHQDKKALSSWSASQGLILRA